MELEAFAIPAVALVALTSLSILITTDWRLNIGLLAAQYAGVFVLVGLSWPLPMAVAKLVAGWMAGAVLGMAMVSLPAAESEAGRSTPAGGEIRQNLARVLTLGPSFHLLAALLVGLTVFSVAPKTIDWAPAVNQEQAWGGLILIGMGLLQLGFTARPFATVVGLLTALAGFEILYAAVETSTLVAGLLAGVNLGLALVGAYLLLAPGMEAGE